VTINTNTGKLTITQTEQKILDKAHSLLTKIAKHGDGSLAFSAHEAHEALADVVKDLNKVEEEVAA
jgi:hypothetical protein